MPMIVAGEVAFAVQFDTASAANRRTAWSVTARLAAAGRSFAGSRVGHLPQQHSFSSFKGIRRSFVRLQPVRRTFCAACGTPLTYEIE